MTEHFGAGLVGKLTRRLPTRRWQVAHWLGKLLVPRTPFAGRFHGGLIEVHPGEVASCGAFFTGFYEREVTMWVMELLRTAPPSLVVDVGANFGYYPLLFGLRSNGHVESIAFEPDPINFGWLTRNLALNPKVKATAVPCIIGDVDDAIVPFLTTLDGHNLWAKVGGAIASEHHGAIIDVAATTLDSYLERHGIVAVPLTLIDVEGHERQVVEGMSRGIATRLYAKVMVEFHAGAFDDATAEIQRIAGKFLAAGYSGYRFCHLDVPSSDKTRDYYNLEWNESVLAPLSYDNLTSWEHFLFVVD